MKTETAAADLSGLRSPASSLSTFRLFRLLLWVHWRSFVARVRGLRKQSPLLIFVLGGFVAGYLLVGYWLFYWGLNFLYNFPLVGALLSQRILFLIFGFFFVMLVFSNSIIGYSTLFKNRETAWFLTLPIAHRDVCRWKIAESLVVSSWALLFLSAPLLAAYGRVHSVSPFFYLATALACIPFVIIPGLLGSWAIMALVRLLSLRWVRRALLPSGILAVIAIVFWVKPVTDVDATVRQDVATFEQLLRHTRVSLNPFLPSAWLAQSVLAWGEGLARPGAFYFLVLLSNALMAVVVGCTVIDRHFYRSWSVAVSSRAERYLRKAGERRHGTLRRGWLEWLLDAVPWLSRPTRALVLKDVRVFWRDPAQWTQFMIFFGLLCIYVLNLRNVAFDFQSEFWETMISYLNLTASALTLSTLTTRFVFPQFSLEGRRLWIIGLAPIGLRRVLWQKFCLACAASMSVTVSLMAASSLMLQMPWPSVFFFSGAIAVMSATLSGLAVGVGALFPNLREENPSKIVSGFGGTLCLVVSFIYITLFVALAAMPALQRVTKFDFTVPAAAALAGALALSAAVLLFPMLLAMRRVKNLEF